MAEELVWIRSSAEWPGGSDDEYISYPREEWEALTEDQREATLFEFAQNTLTNSGCGAGASVVDESEVPEVQR